jgi:hypothetical protein
MHHARWLAGVGVGEGGYRQVPVAQGPCPRNSRNGRTVLGLRERACGVVGEPNGAPPDDRDVLRGEQVE